jgi:DNA-binding MarR family transcriptional regulator
VKDVNLPSLPPLPEGAEPHVAALIGRLLEMVRQVLAAEDRGGLRNSHLRLLSSVPPSGTTITELSGHLFMTKQAVGQFVAQLEETGHVEVRPDPEDGRRRIVLTTDLGRRTVLAVNETIAALEDCWAGIVGVERYAQFREVLEQITRR